MDIKFDSKLWQWQGKDPWHFITVPSEYLTEICMIGSLLKKGFGSVRVVAAIGGCTWKTSVFPDTKSKGYLLPVKKEIRLKESLNDGDNVSVSLKILEP